MENAIRRGNINRVKFLLEIDKADPNMTYNKYKDTPLHLSAQQGEYEIAKLLIEHGANVNLPNSDGETPIVEAIEKDNPRFVRLLLDKGAETDKYLNKIWFPTMHGRGVNMKDEDPIAEILLSYGVSPNTGDWRPTIYPLFHAIKIKDFDLAYLLLEHGADANSCCSSLAEAVCVNVELAETLIKRGANVNCASNPAICMAAERDSYDGICLLIKYGVNINQHRAYSRETPLHLAAKNAEEKTVRLLCENGADVSARDQDGDTPLHKAVAKRENCKKIASTLLEYESDINAVDAKGKTVLNSVVHYNPEAAEFLITHGADVNIADHNKHTPLHMVTIGMHNILPTVNLLVEHDADVNVVDEDGDTPLHCAASHNKQGMMELLIKANCDMNIVNNLGETPAFTALRCGYDNQLLLDNGGKCERNSDDNSDCSHD